MGLTRFQFNDPDLQEFHDETSEAVAGSPFVQGRLITIKDVAIGAFKVKHGLERIPSAWLVVDQDLNALGSNGEHGVYSQANDKRSAQTIELRAVSSYHSLTIWVF